MRFHAAFVKSCAALADLPPGPTPEIALLGRSNVGKSSLLNALTGQAGLARVSRTPGRTQLLNYFSVNEGVFGLVDCPGYGYAKVARTLRQNWSALVGEYLEQRDNLRLAVMLVDAMLPPQASDLGACLWLRQHGRPLLLVATKSDRLSGNQRVQAERALREAFAAEPLLTSATTGAGCDRLRHRLLESARG